MPISSRMSDLLPLVRRLPPHLRHPHPPPAKARQESPKQYQLLIYLRALFYSLIGVVLNKYLMFLSVKSEKQSHGNA